VAELVYLLCALTSLGCAGLLLRGYAQHRTRLLLWASVCFAGLALNNMLLFADLVLVPAVDLSIWRAAISLGALLALLFGLVWDAGE
jgi:hydrogenase/urease accessory protein HupE